MNDSSKREQSEALHITRVFPDGRETERRSAICALRSSMKAASRRSDMETWRNTGEEAVL